MGRAHPPCLPRVCNNQHQQLLCSLPNYETGSPPHSPFPPLRTFAPCVFFQFFSSAHRPDSPPSGAQERDSVPAPRASTLPFYGLIFLYLLCPTAFTRQVLLTDPPSGPYPQVTTTTARTSGTRTSALHRILSAGGRLAHILLLPPAFLASILLPIVCFPSLSPAISAPEPSRIPLRRAQGNAKVAGVLFPRPVLALLPSLVLSAFTSPGPLPTPQVETPTPSFSAHGQFQTKPSMPQTGVPCLHPTPPHIAPLHRTSLVTAIPPFI